MGNNGNDLPVGLIFCLLGLGIVIIGAVVAFFVGPIIPTVPIAGTAVSDIVVAGIIVAIIGLVILAAEMAGGGGGP